MVRDAHKHSFKYSIPGVVLKWTDIDEEAPGVGICQNHLKKKQVETLRKE